MHHFLSLVLPVTFSIDCWVGRLQPVFVPPVFCGTVYFLCPLLSADGIWLPISGQQTLANRVDMSEAPRSSPGLSRQLTHLLAVIGVQISGALTQDVLAFVV